MKKTALYFAVFVLLVIFTGLFMRYLGNTLGAAPEFLLIFLVAASLSEGPYFGIISGFLAGVAADFASVFIPGANCIIYTTIGYISGSLKGKFYYTPLGNQLILVVGASVFNKMALGVAGETFGVRYPVSFKWIILTIVYDAALTPLIFHISRKIAAASGDRD